ncbi:MAG: hypothetical protein LBU92_01500 [Prevotellaceae bacterium]|jgi:Skp family chaperone for outer membrane proteins|nr:hypothetical protein [Prevotellaceae bacterium]
MKHLVIFLAAALISLSAYSQKSYEKELSAEANAELQEDLKQLQKEYQEEIQQLRTEQQEELQRMHEEQQQLQIELQQQQQEQQQLMVEAMEQAEEMRKMTMEVREKKKGNSFGKYEASETKTYNFTLEKNAALEIDNKFGSITVTEWDKPELQMVVERKVISRESQEYAKKRLACIKIEVEKKGQKVEVETEIDCEGSSRNTELKITYTVFAPKGTAYELEQKFGNIALKTNILGKLKAEVKHGSFTAAESLGKFADVEVEFGNANISQAQNLNLTSKHGKATVNFAKRLNLRTAFSKANIGSIDSLVGEAKHGSFSVERVADMSMKFEFSGVKISRIERSLNLAAKHGSVNVENVNDNFSNIKVSAEFGSITLGMSAVQNLSYSAYSQFGDINIPASWKPNASKSEVGGGGTTMIYAGNFPMFIEKKDVNKKEIQGTLGNGASKLEARAKHGSVTIK